MLTVVPDGCPGHDGGKDDAARSLIDEIVREGARRMLAEALRAEVDAYIAEHGVVLNPLVDEGYPSIGCATCTLPVKPGADPRSGRWAGTGKTECGLHV